jgi:hypothetical protein
MTLAVFLSGNVRRGIAAPPVNSMGDTFSRIMLICGYPAALSFSTSKGW